MLQKQIVIATASSSEIVSSPSSKGSSTIDSNKMSNGIKHMESIDLIDWKWSSLLMVKIEHPGESD